jgi:hypothetical protein
MFSSLFISIRHESRRLLGRVLSMIRLHRLERLSIDGVDVVRKRRRCFAHLIIPLGNAFLKFNGSFIVALPTKHWLEWERAIENSTQRNLVLESPLESIAGNSNLYCRSVPGVSLRQLLSDPRCSQEQKSDAIRWSLAALHFLHQVDADWGQGIRQSISHGDATANNVIVDLNSCSACWIDFDTRHLPNVTEDDRRTDDLCSLIYSAAAHLPVSFFSQLADILIREETDTATLTRFRQRLTNEWVHLTTFQLAQAPLRWFDANIMRAALLKALSFE